METDTLREMIMLAEKKNYARAAEQLYISQSALSRHIAALESRLKVQLFERNPRQVRLTSCGEALIPFAKSIIELEDASINKIEEIKIREQKSIRIGSVHGLASYGVMSRIAGFVSENKDLTLNLDYRGKETLIDMLDKGEIDLAIIYADADKQIGRHKSLTLAEDQLVVVLPADHPLAGRDILGITDLSGEEWILQDDNHFMTELMRDMTWGSGISVREAQIHVGGVGTLELVAQGLGIALELKTIAEKHADPALVFVPLSPSKKVRIRLLWPKNLTGPGDQFIEYMRKSRH